MNTQLLLENEERIEKLHQEYSPEAGLNCTGDRVAAGDVLVPKQLLEDFPDYATKAAIERDRLRCRYDFEFWCWRCVKITDKMSGHLIPLVLNRPQRKLLAVMEGQRLRREPIRIILLKARQWGGSTLVQIYIAWLQIVVFKGKNSIIVGHKRNSSFAIKNMMRTVLANYPADMLDDGLEDMKLVNVRESKDIQEITGRDCSICLTSSFSPDSARGLNLSLAHLSEVAFWNSNRNIDPNDLIRTVTGTIPLAPDTVIVMESTANGTNSFFYNEWQRAVEGRSAFTPVFVAWNEIEIYQKPLEDDFELDKCNEYEQALWDKGCTLEQVFWYHEKMKEFSEHNLLKAEFPSDDKEAFENSMDFVFATHEQERICDNISAPARVLEDNLLQWSEPQLSLTPESQHYHQGELSFKWPASPGNYFKSQYLAVLTIGSESDSDHPSVFSIWQVNDAKGKRLESAVLVAQWSGNKPLNLLATMAVTWATRYDNALLVVENNDLQASQETMQQGVFVTNEVFMKYKNLYYSKKRGFVFEVDKKVWSLMFYELILSARTCNYIDHDEQSARAVAKMIVMPNGKYYAEKPQLQNHLINRAEMLYVLRTIDLRI